MVLRNLSSFHKHAENFRALFTESMRKPGSAAGDGELSFIAGNPRGLDKLQKELRQKYTQKEEEALEEIWEKFDVNKDGELSKAETNELVQDYLKKMMEWFPQLMDELFSSSMGFLHDERAAEAFSGLRDSLKPFYDDFLKSMLEQSEELAEEMWKSMDVNHDGKVVKKEFINGFVQCSDDIVNHITRLALYAMFALGFIDFGKFICDVDMEGQTEEDHQLQSELAVQFNLAVREVAQSELQKSDPADIGDFWTTVCRRIRTWLAELTPQTVVVPEVTVVAAPVAAVVPVEVLDASNIAFGQPASFAAFDGIPATTYIGGAPVGFSSFGYPAGGALAQWPTMTSSIGSGTVLGGTTVIQPIATTIPTSVLSNGYGIASYPTSPTIIGGYSSPFATAATFPTTSFPANIVSGLGLSGLSGLGASSTPVFSNYSNVGTSSYYAAAPAQVWGGSNVYSGGVSFGSPYYRTIGTTPSFSFY